MDNDRNFREPPANRRRSAATIQFLPKMPDFGGGGGGGGGGGDGGGGGGDSDGDGDSDSSLLPRLQDDLALHCMALASRSDYAALACLSKRFHDVVRSGELYRIRRREKVEENWIYLVSGDNSGWLAFDPQRRRWKRLPEMPSDDCFNCADKESLAVGTELLVFGKEIDGMAICRYSLVSNKWSKGPPMVCPRCLFASGSSGRIAVIAGGSDQTGAILKSAELYDSEKGVWERLPDMHWPRKLSSGFFMGGKFYVLGGVTKGGIALDSGEEFDFESRRWRVIERMMFNGGGGCGAYAAAPPLVAVVGGELYGVELERNEVIRYRKERKVWERVGVLPVRSEGSNGWGLGFKACGERLVVVGGRRRLQGDGIEVNAWSPKKAAPPQWEVIGVKKRSGVFVFNCAVMTC